MAKIKIIPIGYDNKSVYREDMALSDGKFSASTPFIILSNKPIPKHVKSYFEFKVTDFKRNELYRHLPLYVGIHKEPSSGILSTDFSLGSIYYTRRQDFETYEQYNKSAYCEHYKVLGKKERIPSKNDIIGVGIDPDYNQINIFVNGHPFYSFSPREFEINEEDDFYFTICSRVFENIGGYINYGSAPFEYKPDGYISLNQYYFERYPFNLEILGNVSFLSNDNDTNNYYSNRIKYGVEFGMTVHVENDLAPLGSNLNERKTYIEPNLGDIQLYDQNNKNSFIIYSENQNPADHAYFPYPIPSDQKIYFEFNCKEAPMDNGYVGLPIQIGIADHKEIEKSITDPSYKSFSIDLFRKDYNYYYANVTLNDKTIHYPIRTVYGPVYPMEGDTIGVLLDLKDQTIKIYNNNTLYMTADLNEYLGYADDSRTFVASEKSKIYFNDIHENYYLFVKAYTDSFTGNGHMLFNLGEPENKDPLKYHALYDNKDIMTYWYYYNYNIRKLYYKDLEFVLTTLPYHINVSKNITCSIYVKSKYDGNDLDFGPGLNMMYDTYNIISDNEEKANVPDLTAFEFYELTHNKVDNDQNKFIKDLIMFASVRIDKKVEEYNEMILSSDRFLFRYTDMEQDLLIGNSYISKNKYSKDILSCNFDYINRIKITLIGNENFNIVAITNDGTEHTEDFYMLPSPDNTIEVHTRPKKEYSLQSQEPYFEYNDDAEINVGKKVYNVQNDMEIALLTPPTLKYYLNAFITGHDIYHNTLFPCEKILDGPTQRRIKEVKLPKGVTKLRVYYIHDPYQYDERRYFEKGDMYINELIRYGGNVEETLKRDGLLNDDLYIVRGGLHSLSGALAIFDSHNAIKWYDTRKQKNMPPPVAPFTIKSLDNDYIWGNGAWKKGNANFGSSCAYKCTVGITPEKTYKIMSFGPARDVQYGFFLYYGPEVKDDVVDMADY